MTDTPSPAPGRGRARLVAAVVVAVVVALVVLALVWVVSRDDDEATGPGVTQAPYVDPRSAGGLTLCSASGEPVTGGSVTDTPFAATVVGETGLPPGVDPTGAVATLFGYQPRQGIGADEFTGIPLTATATLVDPARPAVPVSTDVYSIGDFVAGYPATWDGFVQLRLYLGTPQAGTLTESPYDTADLRVEGDRWELVRGGDADCSDQITDPSPEENR